MKHVVTAAAPLRRRVLVTGFGAFPGAPRNPTAEILRQLERETGRLERLGIVLRCVMIPVVYAEIEPTLARAVAAHRPDAVLHLGLASRRKRISVETRAINRVGPLHPGADGRVPAHQVLSKGGPQSLGATYPAARIVAAIRRTGLNAGRSIDAGDYVCNATLYHALLERIAPQVGFLHVPLVRRRGARILPCEAQRSEGGGPREAWWRGQSPRTTLDVCRSLSTSKPLSGGSPLHRLRRPPSPALRAGEDSRTTTCVNCLRRVATGRPTIESLTRATIGAILVMARPQLARSWAAAASAPKARSTDGALEAR